MSTIARARTVIGSLYALLRNRLGLNVATQLEAQELSCTVAPDRRLVVLGHEPIAGFARDHGTVADEAAMLALHTLDSTTLLAEPRFVAPGDSVLRADDPGWRWHCIAGHGQTLSDWERRPLGDTVADAIDLLATKIGSSALDGYLSEAEAEEQYQPLLTNRTTLAKITESKGAPLWNGSAWPGGGSGSTFTPQSLSALSAWYTADAGVLKGDGSAATAGDSVATWQDQSGGANHLSQASASRRPVLTAKAIGSHAALLFDGDDDYMLVTTGPTIALANCTIVAFVKSLTSDPSKRFVVLGPVGTSGLDYDTATRAMLGQASGTNYCYFWSNDRSVAIAGPRPAPVGAYVGRIRNSGLQLSDNDTAWAGTVGTSDLGNAVGILLAAGYNAGTIDPTWGLNGYIAEVCIYSRALTAYEIGQLVAYLNARWG